MVMLLIVLRYPEPKPFIRSRNPFALMSLQTESKDGQSKKGVIEFIVF